MKSDGNRWGVAAACAALAAATLAAFWPLLHSEFIRLDDAAYVVRNPHVRTGLSWENVGWAFRTGQEGNWHPVTWLSHMLDATLYGLRPGWHHLTSLLLHVANTLLLFHLFRALTGAAGRSALVAGLFALHPLHVESVAWIAERKDVLSTFFFLLTLLAYRRYVRPGGRPEPKDRSPNATAQSSGLKVQSSRFKVQSSRFGLQPPASLFYVLALAWFALGLMSKPMLVTLPFVLLLLDYWPLGRFEAAEGPVGAGRRLGELAWEKAPFFGLSLASSVLAFLLQQRVSENLVALPLSSRLDNAVVSYVKYLGKTFWPVDLAVFYPHPDLRYPVSHQWPWWGIAAAGLFLLAMSALAVRQRRRAPWLGVGWFWYLGTLVPVIGAIQVGRQALADRYTYLPLIGLFLCVVWGVAEGWRAVWRKAELGQTPPSILGAMGVAALLACACVTRAQAGYWHDNFTLFRHALAVTKDNAVAHFHVGTWLGSQQGQFSLARDHFLAAVTADPTYPPPYYPLGLILAAQGKPLQAMAYLREGIKLQPEWVLAIDELAWLLATHPQAEVRNGAEAVRWAERACTLTGGQNAHCWNTLGAACAEAGRFTEAIQATERALALAQAAGQTNEVAAAQARLALYRQQKPCREEP